MILDKDRDTGIVSDFAASRYNAVCHANNAPAYLVVAAIMFWQGGLTFYASVVVPIGSDVLGSHADQGMITRRVVVYLHIARAVALALLAWDIAAANDDERWRRLSRWGLWR